MKTTLELPDELLTEAKAVAARRRTTLRALVEHALRRELSPPSPLGLDHAEHLEMGPHGILRLKPRGVKVTSAGVRKFMDEAEAEEFQKAIGGPEERDRNR